MLQNQERKPYTHGKAKATILAAQNNNPSSTNTDHMSYGGTGAPDHMELGGRGPTSVVRA